MPYIGKTTDGFGVRNRFVYLASSGATSVTVDDVDLASNVINVGDMVSFFTDSGFGTFATGSVGNNAYSSTNIDSYQNMCGIFGLIYNNNNQGIVSNKIEADIKVLATLSESRGKEASGITIIDKKNMHIIKKPIPTTKLMKSDVYTHLLQNIFNDNKVL